MATVRVPCPNPICPYDFTPDEYSAAISCPRCGTMLPELAPAGDDLPTAPTLPAAIPFATPTSAPELILPTVSPWAVAAPPAGGPRAVPRRGGPLGLVLPVLVSGVVVALLTAGLLILFNRKALFSEGGSDAVVLKEFNCSFRKPDAPGWQRSDALRRASDGELAFERADPVVSAVLAAKDYKSRTPRPDELYAEAARRITALVPNAGIEEPGVAPPVAGQAVRRLVFQGEVGETTVSGECSLFAHQGVGYWLLIWTPAADVGRAATEFAAVRGGLNLLDERAGWQESGGGTLLIASDKSFSVRDVDAWWEKFEPPTDFAPEARLALRLSQKKIRTVRKDPTAEVVIFRLEQSGPPAEVARQFAQEWLRRGAYKQAAVEDWGGQSAGELPPAAPGPLGAFGPPQRLRVKKTPALSDFALLAAAERGGAIFAAWCACQSPRDWEPAFRILLETFRFEGG